MKSSALRRYTPEPVSFEGLAEAIEAARPDEQSLLAGDEADPTLQTISDELERIEPDLGRLRARQQEIARELRSR